MSRDSDWATRSKPQKSSTDISHAPIALLSLASAWASIPSPDPTPDSTATPNTATPNQPSQRPQTNPAVTAVQQPEPPPPPPVAPGPLTVTKCAPVSAMTARASRVFPQPGGPNSSTPRGAGTPTRLKISGCLAKQTVGNVCSVVIFSVRVPSAVYVQAAHTRDGLVSSGVVGDTMITLSPLPARSIAVLWCSVTTASKLERGVHRKADLDHLKASVSWPHLTAPGGSEHSVKKSRCRRNPTIF